MEGNKAGVIFVVIVLIAMAGGLFLEVNPPTIKAFSLPAVPAKGVEHYQNITLYACADGWDYGHGPINPTLVVANDTVVCFTVIEEGDQPHTLTIAPGSSETSYQDTLLTTSQITTVPGTVSHVKAFFDKVGVYTYWCTVHPETMVGALYVNSTVNVTIPTVHYSYYHNETLNLVHNGFRSNGILNSTIPLPQNSLVNFTVKDKSLTNYSLLLSPGVVPNLNNYTTIINTTNKEANTSFAFNSTGEYTYFNGLNTSQYGYVYVYTSLLNQTLFADKNGWNYSQTSGVNPTITVSACTLVNFTLIDEDNLTHTLVINTGNNENTTDYTVIATVNATTNMSQGYYFFLTPGNYTYWDLYHPGTAVGTINVTNTSSGASVVYSPASASYNVQSTLYFTAKDEKTL